MKMSRLKKSITCVLIASTYMLFMSGCPENSTQDSNKKKSVRIAINVPETSPIAGWSGQFSNGFRMGLEDAAKKYNVDPSIFKVDVQDNGGDPKKASDAYNKHSIDGFDAYISVATGPANAVAEKLDLLKTKPHFIAAFDPFITQKSENRMRLMANSKIEAPLIVKYIQERKAKKVSILQLNMSYAQEEVKNMIVPMLEKMGIKTQIELFELKDRDFKNKSVKIKQQTPDLTVIIGYSFHIQPALQAFRENNLINDGNVITSMDLVDLLYSGENLNELENVAFVCPLFDIPGRIQDADSWKARFKEKYGKAPTYVPAYAYDNAQALVKAYAEKSNVDVESVLAATPFNGITGEIAFDDDRDIISTVDLAIIKQGKPSPVQQSSKKEAATATK